MPGYRRTHSCTGEEETEPRLEDGKCGYSETVYAYNTERKCKSGCACETCVEAGTVRGEGNSTAAAQADANNKAQQQANSMTCNTQYRSVQKSGSATRNNCGSGCTGSSVTYTVEAGKYTSCVSQADADNQAQTDVNNNKQSYANSHGECTCPSCSIDLLQELYYDTPSACRLHITCQNITADNCTAGTRRIVCNLTGCWIEVPNAGAVKISDHSFYIDVTYPPGSYFPGIGLMIEEGYSMDTIQIDYSNYTGSTGNCPDCDINVTRR